MLTDALPDAVTIVVEIEPSDPAFAANARSWVEGALAYYPHDTGIFNIKEVTEVSTDAETLRALDNGQLRLVLRTRI